VGATASAVSGGRVGGDETPLTRVVADETPTATVLRGVEAGFAAPILEERGFVVRRASGEGLWAGQSRLEGHDRESPAIGTLCHFCGLRRCRMTRGAWLLKAQKQARLPATADTPRQGGHTP
jgi:hypothetical protein